MVAACLVLCAGLGVVLQGLQLQRSHEVPPPTHAEVQVGGGRTKDASNAYGPDTLSQTVAMEALDNVDPCASGLSAVEEQRLAETHTQLQQLAGIADIYGDEVRSTRAPCHTANASFRFFVWCSHTWWPCHPGTRSSPTAPAILYVVLRGP